MKYPTLTVVLLLSLFLGVSRASNLDSIKPLQDSTKVVQTPGIAIWIQWGYDTCYNAILGQLEWGVAVQTDSIRMIRINDTAYLQGETIASHITAVPHGTEISYELDQTKWLFFVTYDLFQPSNEDLLKWQYMQGQAPELQRKSKLGKP